MKQVNNIDNQIFVSTLIGVLLLIATTAGYVIGFRHMPDAHLSYLSLLLIPGTTGGALLFKAMKKDRKRYLDF